MGLSSVLSTRLRPTRRLQILDFVDLGAYTHGVAAQNEQRFAKS